MPSYLSLLNWTDQGMSAIKDSPARVDAAKQAIEAAGGRMIFYYVLMGQYDAATLVEMPDDDGAARLLLAMGSAGNFRSQTMRAFTEDESRALIGSLP